MLTIASIFSCKKYLTELLDTDNGNFAMVLFVAAAVPGGREGSTLHCEGGEGDKRKQRPEASESSGAA